MGPPLIEKVLVAIDGSDNSDRALNFALDFSEKFKAGLTVLNVSEISAVTAVPPDIMGYSGEGVVVLEKDFRKIHEGILAKAIDYAKQVKPNLQVSAVLREGDPASEIVALAKDGGFDFLVVGHRGLGKLREIFLGNISERVAHLAPCSVVIVR